LRVYIYHNEINNFSKDCESILLRHGFEIVGDPVGAQFSVAPLLQKKVDANLSESGLLVFHPSLLPLYRGIDAIKWQFWNRETTGGVTWFWANNVLDGGDICRQSCFVLNREQSFRSYYEGVCLSEGLRLFEIIVKEFKNGIFVRTPQNNDLATSQPKFNIKPMATVGEGI
jgi:methionyl-tRNA formyltransferase